MCFQRQNIFNYDDYIISPVADAKKTPSLGKAILAFQVVAVYFVDN